MRFKDFKFNEINEVGLSIFVGTTEVAVGFIGKVLAEIPHLSEHEIESTNNYFDVFVIRLKEPHEGDGIENLKEK